MAKPSRRNESSSDRALTHVVLAGGCGAVDDVRHLGGDGDETDEQWSRRDREDPSAPSTSCDEHRGAGHEVQHDEQPDHDPTLSGVAPEIRFCMTGGANSPSGDVDHRARAPTRTCVGARDRAGLRVR